jgi:hypothetical protein
MDVEIADRASCVGSVVLDQLGPPIDESVGD